jgi:hypothetical protein
MNSKRGPDITLAPELKQQDSSIAHFDWASSFVNGGISSRELNNTSDKISYTGMGLALEAGSAPYSLYPREVKGMDVGGVLGDYIYLVANSRFLALSYEQKKTRKRGNLAKNVVLGLCWQNAPKVIGLPRSFSVAGSGVQSAGIRLTIEELPGGCQKRNSSRAWDIGS